MSMADLLLRIWVLIGSCKSHNSYLWAYLCSVVSLKFIIWAGYMFKLRVELYLFAGSSISGRSIRISTIKHEAGLCYTTTFYLVSKFPFTDIFCFLWRYAAIFASFVAGMACLVGIDFSAKLLASLGKYFEVWTLILELKALVHSQCMSICNEIYVYNCIFLLKLLLGFLVFIVAFFLLLQFWKVTNSKSLGLQNEFLKADNLSLRNLTLLLSYLCVFGVCSRLVN